MSLAVGGNYQAFGIMQRELLIQHGLRPDHYVVDVGCGSGRLGSALAQFLRGSYLGIDVVPELLAYARKRCPAHWRFEVAEGLTIPSGTSQADFICFFSVFTHLLHEESYRYLQEAVRVLKPRGRIVFSFLEFAVGCTWDVFDRMVKAERRTWLDMFISRDAIEAWAEHLALSIKLLQRGDEPFIPLPHPVVLDDGSRQEGLGCFGQSIAVLSKP